MTTEPAARTLVPHARVGVGSTKVPQLTGLFWVTKLLSAIVAVAVIDYLDHAVGLSLSGTTLVAVVGLAVALSYQLRAGRYLAWAYWTTLLLTGVVGTLLVEDLAASGIPTSTSTPWLALLLAATLVAWYAAEHTLSLRSIRTYRREAFYWLAVLLSFALGAAGEELSRQIGFGYLLSIGVFAATVTIVAVAHWGLGLGSVASFWLAFVLTRPLGISIADYLAQSRRSGAVGLGTTPTDLVFVAAMLALVAYLSVTRRDVPVEGPDDAEPVPPPSRTEAHLRHP